MTVGAGNSCVRFVIFGGPCGFVRLLSLLSPLSLPLPMEGRLTTGDLAIGTDMTSPEITLNNAGGVAFDIDVVA